MTIVSLKIDQICISQSGRRVARGGLLLQVADELAVEAEELAREGRVVLRTAPRVRERRFAALLGERVICRAVVGRSRDSPCFFFAKDFPCFFLARSSTSGLKMSAEVHQIISQNF